MAKRTWIYDPACFDVYFHLNRNNNKLDIMSSKNQAQKFKLYNPPKKKAGTKNPGFFHKSLNYLISTSSISKIRTSLGPIFPPPCPLSP